MSVINELIDQIGGRERLEQMSQCSDVTKLFAYEMRHMARALLDVLDAKPAYYIHRVEACDSYGPEVDLRVFIYELDASKCKDDHGGEVIEVFTAPPAASMPDGYKLVPIEPSKEMLLASKRYKAKNKVPTGPGFYRAMIAAAPAPGGDDASAPTTANV